MDGEDSEEKEKRVGTSLLAVVEGSPEDRSEKGSKKRFFGGKKATGEEEDGWDGKDSGDNRRKAEGGFGIAKKPNPIMDGEVVAGRMEIGFDGGGHD